MRNIDFERLLVVASLASAAVVALSLALFAFLLEGPERSGETGYYIVIGGSIAAALAVFAVILIRLGIRRRFFRWLVGSGSGRYSIFVVLTLVAAGALSYTFWSELAGSEDGSVSTTIRNMVFVVGGVLALPLAVWRGYVAERQVTATEESVATAQASIANQRFQTAAQMLGHDLNAVRLGAIHALTDLAREDPTSFHVGTAMLLAAFVRNPPTGSSVIQEETRMPSGRAVREDVVAALTSLGQRTEDAVRAEEEQEYRINLEGQDFAGMTFKCWNLRRMDLRDTNFFAANLEGSDLSNSDLSGCTLTSAHVTAVTFGDTKLSAANFTQWQVSDDGSYRSELNNPDARSVFGLTQEQLDFAQDDQNEPPKLREIKDAETELPLNWHGLPPARL